MTLGGEVELPLVSLDEYLAGAPSNEQCQLLADALKKYGAAVVRDPRVGVSESDEFLNQMEAYFQQSSEDKMQDVRPSINYQVGGCPEGTEVPRDHRSKIEELDAPERPTVPEGADPKWRFFWRIGERPSTTEYPELNAKPVLPARFPDWQHVMDNWGTQLMQTIYAVAEMLALGLDLPREAILDVLDHGPHLLAPTGSDLAKFGTLGRVLAGFHYDLNALTIHGKSRFPGLYIWTTDGQRMPCKVPAGCLLVQAGIQIEYLTAGVIKRGFHEVVVDENTLLAVDKATSEGRPTWRVSSTLFAHVASDKVLEPLGHFRTEPGAESYGPVAAGRQVLGELQLINLAKT